jgi:hypothetical protein
MEDALSGFRVVTNGGCPFWFQRSYRKRMSFLLSEELDGGIRNSSETRKGILRL